MCGEEKCDCDCECGTAPLSGDRYLEDDCGCDPDNCHNKQYPGVSTVDPPILRIKDAIESFYFYASCERRRINLFN